MIFEMAIDIKRTFEEGLISNGPASEYTDKTIS